jgi:hypothetical protein
MLIVLALGVVALIVWMRAGAGKRPESQLLKICQGDQAQAQRLLEAEINRAPGISRGEAAARAVHRYQRDNR